MLSTIGRMIVVPIAFLLAALAAILVLVTLGYERIIQAMARGDFPDRFEAVFDLVGNGVAIFAGLTVLPALALVVVGEVARIRSFLYYVLGGGLALVAIPLLAQLGWQPGPDGLTALWQVFATAGFAGGLVYWLLAGRRA